MSVGRVAGSTDGGRHPLRKKEPHVLAGREWWQSPYRPRPAPLHPAVAAGVENRAGGSSQGTPKKARRQRKNAAWSHSRTRQWLTWGIGGCAAISGFIAVLWLTDPASAPHTPAMTILTNATVSDAASMMAAVQTAGLRGTSDVKGSIEEITRLDNGRASIKGWVTDTTAAGSALTVIAFAGGKHVLTTVTNGARADVAKMLGLAGASAANMSFQGTFACRPGGNIIVIAVTSGGAYSQFRSLACP